MKLADLSPDMVVKIGTEKGTGYLYAGPLKDANLAQINAAEKAKLEKSYSNALHKLREMPIAEIKASNIKHLYRCSENLNNFIPIEQREIVETFTSIIEPEVTAVILKGAGTGDIWTLKKKSNFEVNSMEGCLDLVGAILKTDVAELSRLYRIIYEKPSDTIAKASIQDIHAVIRSNPYGQLKDPDAVIRMTLSNTVKDICEDTDLDPDEVETKIRLLVGLPAREKEDA